MTELRLKLPKIVRQVKSSGRGKLTGTSWDSMTRKDPVVCCLSCLVRSKASLTRLLSMLGMRFSYRPSLIEFIIANSPRRLMYGANNLVWQGVQNATIGTIYTTEYGFSTAAVSAAYAGGVLGTIIG